MENLTLYFILASVVMAILGYLIGSKKLYSQPVIFFAVFVLFLPLIINIAIWAYGSSVPEVIVPNILGYSSSEAVSILKNSGLNGEITTVSFSKGAAGIIISQEPQGGKRVKKGRNIKLSISASEPLISTPNLIGKSSEEADGIISNSGLAKGVVYGESSDKNRGIVINQNPAPQTRVAPGTPVSILISTGEVN